MAKGVKEAVIAAEEEAGELLLIWIKEKPFTYNSYFGGSDI